MIVITSNQISEEQVQHIVSEIEKEGLQAHVSKGRIAR